MVRGGGVWPQPLMISTEMRSEKSSEICTSGGRIAAGSSGWAPIPVIVGSHTGNAAPVFPRGKMPARAAYRNCAQEPNIKGLDLM